MIFGDEAGIHELREVLADRVVVQAVVVCELRDVHRTLCVGHIPEDAVARRIAEGPGLFLKRCHASVLSLTAEDIGSFLHSSLEKK